MAKIVQIVATDPDNPNFEADLAEAGTWHAIATAGDAVRTVCGVQLEGDDGYGPGDDKEGKVTCQLCRSILADIQAIKGWR